jgi:hypothetical protein
MVQHYSSLIVDFSRHLSAIIHHSSSLQADHELHERPSLIASTLDEKLWSQESSEAAIGEKARNGNDNSAGSGDSHRPPVRPFGLSTFLPCRSYLVWRYATLRSGLGKRKDVDGGAAQGQEAGLRLSNKRGRIPHYLSEIHIIISGRICSIAYASWHWPKDD